MECAAPLILRYANNHFYSLPIARFFLDICWTCNAYLNFCSNNTQKRRRKKKKKKEEEEEEEEEKKKKKKRERRKEEEPISNRAQRRYYIHINIFLPAAKKVRIFVYST